MPLKYSSIDAPKAHCTWASFNRCAILFSNSIFFCISVMMHLVHYTGICSNFYILASAFPHHVLCGVVLCPASCSASALAARMAF